MESLALSPPQDTLFRLIRQGLPMVGAVALLLAIPLQSNLAGWFILGAVALLADLLPTFRTGASFLRSRPFLMRWDGLWVRAFRPLMRTLGLEERWILAFCHWNNRRIAQAFRNSRARRGLVLLPHCIQMAACKAEVISDLSACYECGKCPVEDVLEASLVRRWDVRLSNRSHKAYREAREAMPELIVAVSCTDRLLKGLLKLPEIPSYVIPLQLPHGMCVDTTFDPRHLVAAMEALVEPRPHPVTPLARPESA